MLFPVPCEVEEGILEAKVDLCISIRSIKFRNASCPLPRNLKLPLGD